MDQGDAQFCALLNAPVKLDGSDTIIRAGTLRYDGVICSRPDVGSPDTTRKGWNDISKYTIGESSEIEADNIPWYKVSATKYISKPIIFASYNSMEQIVKNMNDAGVVIDGSKFSVRMIQDHPDFSAAGGMLYVSDELDDMRLLRQCISYQTLKEMVFIGTGTLTATNPYKVIERGGKTLDDSTKTGQGGVGYVYWKNYFGINEPLYYMFVLESK